MALDAEAVKCIVNLRDVLGRPLLSSESRVDVVKPQPPYCVAQPQFRGSSLKTC